MLLGWLLLMVAGPALSQEKLYVFYPTTTRPQTVREKMATAFSGVTVTVFGRYNDFIAKIKLDPPHAIITKPALIQQLGNFTIAANAVRKGKTDESYVLISVGAPVDPSTITAENVIGVIDLLGRAGTKAFAEQFFKVEPKLKRVTKVEDLLPLLSFRMATGIVIEDIYVNFFKSTSQMQFSITPLTGGTGGILALGIRKNCKADKTVAALKKNDKEICGMLEVELWR